MQLGVLFHI